MNNRLRQLRRQVRDDSVRVQHFQSNLGCGVSSCDICNADHSSQEKGTPIPQASTIAAFVTDHPGLSFFPMSFRHISQSKSPIVLTRTAVAEMKRYFTRYRNGELEKKIAAIIAEQKVNVFENNNHAEFANWLEKYVQMRELCRGVLSCLQQPPSEAALQIGEAFQQESATILNSGKTESTDLGNRIREGVASKAKEGTGEPDPTDLLAQLLNEVSSPPIISGAKASHPKDDSTSLLDNLLDLIGSTDSAPSASGAADAHAALGTGNEPLDDIFSAFLQEMTGNEPETEADALLKDLAANTQQESTENARDSSTRKVAAPSSFSSEKRVPELALVFPINELRVKIISVLYMLWLSKHHLLSSLESTSEQPIVYLSATPELSKLSERVWNVAQENYRTDSTLSNSDEGKGVSLASNSLSYVQHWIARTFKGSFSFTAHTDDNAIRAGTPDVQATIPMVHSSTHTNEAIGSAVDDLVAAPHDTSLRQQRVWNVPSKPASQDQSIASKNEKTKHKIDTPEVKKTSKVHELYPGFSWQDFETSSEDEDEDENEAGPSHYWKGEEEEFEKALDAYVDATSSTSSTSEKGSRKGRPAKNGTEKKPEQTDAAGIWKKFHFSPYRTGEDAHDLWRVRQLWKACSKRKKKKIYKRQRARARMQDMEQMFAGVAIDSSPLHEMEEDDDYADTAAGLNAASRGGAAMVPADSMTKRKPDISRPVFFLSLEEYTRMSLPLQLLHSVLLVDVIPEATSSPTRGTSQFLSSALQAHLQSELRHSHGSATNLSVESLLNREYTEVDCKSALNELQVLTTKRESSAISSGSIVTIGRNLCNVLGYLYSCAKLHGKDASNESLNEAKQSIAKYSTILLRIASSHLFMKLEKASVSLSDELDVYTELEQLFRAERLMYIEKHQKNRHFAPIYDISRLISQKSECSTESVFVSISEYVAEFFPMDRLADREDPNTAGDPNVVSAAGESEIPLEKEKTIVENLDEDERLFKESMETSENKAKLSLMKTLERQEETLVFRTSEALLADTDRSQSTKDPTLVLENVSRQISKNLDPLQPCTTSSVGKEMKPNFMAFQAHLSSKQIRECVEAGIKLYGSNPSEYHQDIPSSIVEKVNPLSSVDNVTNLASQAEPVGLKTYAIGRLNCLTNLWSEGVLIEESWLNHASRFNLAVPASPNGTRSSLGTDLVRPPPFKKAFFSTAPATVPIPLSNEQEEVALPSRKIFILGPRQINRAMHGDVVIVELLAEAPQTLFPSFLYNMFIPPQFKYLSNLETMFGRVVAIVSRETDRIPAIIMTSEEYYQKKNEKRTLNKKSPLWKSFLPDRIKTELLSSATDKYATLTIFLEASQLLSDSLSSDHELVKREVVELLLEMIATYHETVEESALSFVRHNLVAAPVDRRYPLFRLPISRSKLSTLMASTHSLENGEKQSDAGSLPPLRGLIRLFDWKQNSFSAEGYIETLLGPAGDPNATISSALRTLGRGRNVDGMKQKVFAAMPQLPPTQRYSVLWERANHAGKTVQALAAKGLLPELFAYYAHSVRAFLSSIPAEAAPDKERDSFLMELAKVFRPLNSGFESLTVGCDLREAFLAILVPKESIQALIHSFENVLSVSPGNLEQLLLLSANSLLSQPLSKSTYSNFLSSVAVFRKSKDKNVPPQQNAQQPRLLTFWNTVLSTAPPVGFSDRRDLRFTHCALSIDPIGCVGMDDSISIRFLSDTRLEVGIHNTDVPEFITENTALDASVHDAVTSIYFPGSKETLLPSKLAGNITSLRGRVDRMTVSVMFEVELEGDESSDIDAAQMTEHNALEDRQFLFEETKDAPAHAYCLQQDKSGYHPQRSGAITPQNIVSPQENSQANGRSKFYSNATLHGRRKYRIDENTLWVGKTIIHNRHSLTYEQAVEIAFHGKDSSYPVDEATTPPDLDALAAEEFADPYVADMAHLPPIFPNTANVPSIDASPQKRQFDPGFLSLLDPVSFAPAALLRRRWQQKVYPKDATSGSHCGTPVHPSEWEELSYRLRTLYSVAEWIRLNASTSVLDFDLIDAYDDLQEKENAEANAPVEGEYEDASPAMDMDEQSLVHELSEGKRLPSGIQIEPNRLTSRYAVRPGTSEKEELLSLVRGNNMTLAIQQYMVMGNTLVSMLLSTFGAVQNLVKHVFDYIPIEFKEQHLVSMANCAAFLNLCSPQSREFLAQIASQTQRADSKELVPPDLSIELTRALYRYLQECLRSVQSERTLGGAYLGRFPLQFLLGEFTFVLRHLSRFVTNQVGLRFTTPINYAGSHHALRLLSLYLGTSQRSIDGLSALVAQAAQFPEALVDRLDLEASTTELVKYNRTPSIPDCALKMALWHPAISDTASPYAYTTYSVQDPFRLVYTAVETESYGDNAPKGPVLTKAYLPRAVELTSLIRLNIGSLNNRRIGNEYSNNILRKALADQAIVTRAILMSIKNTNTQPISEADSITSDFVRNSFEKFTVDPHSTMFKLSFFVPLINSTVYSNLSLVDVLQLLLPESEAPLVADKNSPEDYETVLHSLQELVQCRSAPDFEQRLQTVRRMRNLFHSTTYAKIDLLQRLSIPALSRFLHESACPFTRDIPSISSMLPSDPSSIILNTASDQIQYGDTPHRLQVGDVFHVLVGSVGDSPAFPSRIECVLLRPSPTVLHMATETDSKFTMPRALTYVLARAVRRGVRIPGYLSMLSNGGDLLRDVLRVLSPPPPEHKESGTDTHTNATSASGGDSRKDGEKGEDKAAELKDMKQKSPLLEVYVQRPVDWVPDRSDFHGDKNTIGKRPIVFPSMDRILHSTHASVVAAGAKTPFAEVKVADDSILNSVALNKEKSLYEIAETFPKVYTLTATTVPESCYFTNVLAVVNATPVSQPIPESTETTPAQKLRIRTRAKGWNQYGDHEFVRLGHVQRAHQARMAQSKLESLRESKSPQASALLSPLHFAEQASRTLLTEAMQEVEKEANEEDIDETLVDQQKSAYAKYLYSSSDEESDGVGGLGPKYRQDSAWSAGGGLGFADPRSKDVKVYHSASIEYYGATENLDNVAGTLRGAHAGAGYSATDLMGSYQGLRQLERSVTHRAQRLKAVKRESNIAKKKKSSK